MDVNTGIAGGASNARNNDSANSLALDSCNKKHGKRANKCQYIGSFSNSCGAIYWSPVNKKYGWAWAELNVNDAQIIARRTCINAGGKNCQLRLSFCNSRIFY